MASLRQNKRSDSAIRVLRLGREDLEAHFEAIFALDHACFQPGIAYSRAELRYFLLHPRSISLIAEDAAGLVGFAIAQFHLAQGKRTGHIITMDVASSHRRRGIGRILMNHLLDLCRESETRLLRLEVAVDNHAAIVFYKLFGFHETGRIPSYYMDRIDALSMEIELAAVGV